MSEPLTGCQCWCWRWRWGLWSCGWLWWWLKVLHWARWWASSNQSHSLADAALIVVAVSSPWLLSLSIRTECLPGHVLNRFLFRQTRANQKTDGNWEICKGALITMMNNFQLFATSCQEADLKNQLDVVALQISPRGLCCVLQLYKPPCCAVILIPVV